MKNLTRLPVFILLLVIMLAGSANWLLAAGSLLIKNATILPVTGPPITGGDVLVIDGIIKQIGRNLTAPPGIRIIEAHGKYLIPGIIDTHTHLALSGTNEGTEAITPEVNMADVINPDDPAIFTALSGGVTMVHTMHGSANVIGGVNVVLKMKWGQPSEKLVVREAYPTLKFALGENVKQSNRTLLPGRPQRYPATRMGANAIIRRELLRARDYMAEWDRYEKLKNSKNPPANLLPPKKDLRLETLADLLRGKLYARCHAYVATEMVEFLNLAREFGFKVAALEHAWEAYKITDELLAAGVGISVFIDSWAYKMEAAEGIAYNASYCTQRGVLVSINSDSSERVRRLFNEAGKAVKYGLTPDEALKMITINAARQLGVDRLVGSIEVGKQADLALFNEHPMSAYTRCDLTIIEGEVYFDRQQVIKEREEAARKGGN
ncbi:MAG: Secreted enzyme, contains two amidohydrolase related domains [Candidatus Saccharicenans subterraneus]|uniref:Secreted enzyme, contains two amidohydrolase related domains n=1 Tax=Candidatus Saccharicenans subterraneus TaxID=2508984 RepID=A0A3E2BP64_9BACT|nr:MAG: Secreted enzyme, contains two amidohydrolase related domains [Candidatus Saccharicenans subterraneum]